MGDDHGIQGRLHKLLKVVKVDEDGWPILWPSMMSLFYYQDFYYRFVDGN